MQFRKFAAYDKTAAQSLFTVPCTLIKLDGNYTGSGGEYLQIFDKATAAAANDVPIASFVLSGAGPLPSIFETMGAVSMLNGLSIGISTVNEKYTASASSYDIFGGIALMELPVTETAVGPTDVFSTGLLDVWDATLAGGIPKLSRIVYTNGAPAATKRWLVVYAATASDTDSTPLLILPMFKSTFDSAGTETVVNISTANLSFGGGYSPFGRASDVGGNLAQCRGCFLLLTDTANPAAHTGSLNNVTTDHTTITAYYKFT